MVRPRDVVLGVAGAVVVLIGPAPADIAALFQHPAAACVSACGQTNAWWDQPVLVGQTNTWWDQPVLVAHADELPPAAPPAAPHRGGH
jgi:hypothetical protein